MTHWNFYHHPTTIIPFTLRGYPGTVAVYYGLNDEPIRAGMDSIPGLDAVLDLTVGYPILHARIQDYAGSGYRTFCGWLQIITSVYYDSHEKEAAPIKTFTSVDVAPSMREADTPFLALGFLPQLFDAPCLNLGPHAKLHWTADAFLTSLPIKSRDEGVAPLLGFRWGYIETNLPERKPAPLPLTLTEAHIWNDHLPFLQTHYPHWKFNRCPIASEKPP